MKKILYLVLFIISVFLVSRVDAYTKYSVGDVVLYKGIDYYVIENSDTTKETVKLLKSQPLSVDDVNQYGGFGTKDNHINVYIGEKYTEDSSSMEYHKAYNVNGYGGMAYYTSFDCGNGSDSNHTYDGCISSYEQSEIKYVVDAWAKDKVGLYGLQEARLITYNELINNLGYEIDEEQTGYKASRNNTPSWVYDEYCYWTMSGEQDSSSLVFIVGRIYDRLNGGVVFNSNIVVRPVIVLKKTALGDADESIVTDNLNND